MLNSYSRIQTRPVNLVPIFPLLPFLYASLTLAPVSVVEAEYSPSKVAPVAFIAGPATAAAPFALAAAPVFVTVVQFTLAQLQTLTLAQLQGLFGPEVAAAIVAAAPAAAVVAVAEEVVEVAAAPAAALATQAVLAAPLVAQALQGGGTGGLSYFTSFLCASLAMATVISYGFYDIYKDLTLLELAVRNDNELALKALLALGFDPNNKEISLTKYYHEKDFGITSLYYETRDTESVEPLEKSFDREKVYAEIGKREDVTLLHYIARHNKVEACKILLENGSVNLNDNFEALREAVARGHLDIVDLLLEHGVLPTYGRSLLLLAAIQDRTDIVKTLLNHGTNSNINLYIELNPKFCAIHEGEAQKKFCHSWAWSNLKFIGSKNFELLELLLENGAYFEYWVQNVVYKELIEHKSLGEEFKMIEYYSQQKYNDILHGNLEDVAIEAIEVAGDLFNSTQVLC